MSGQGNGPTVRKAPLCLDFIIVGGSISGLAAAFTLRRIGHNVTVIEKTDGTLRSRGGIRSPPNMSKVLTDWGLLSELNITPQPGVQFVMHNGYFGDTIGRMKWDESFLGHLYSSLYFLQHGDLQSCLYRQAKEAGAQFVFGQTVVDSEPNGASVTLSNGETLTGDIVIAADGYDSRFRRQVTGEDEEDVDLGLEEQAIFLTFQVPTEILKADEGLAPLASPMEWNIFLGDGWLLNGNLVANGTEFAASLIYPYLQPLKDGDEDWKPRTFDEFGVDRSRFEPRALKLLDLAVNLSGRAFRGRPPVDNVVCTVSKTVLVGEAAYSLMPCGHHNTSLGIEDAETLAGLFVRIRRRDQIPFLLNAFEEIRHSRIAFARQYESEWQRSFKVPVGPEMEKRDAGVRVVMNYETWEHMDEDTFRLAWEKELMLVGHNASEAVADWWTQWGSYFEKEEKKKGPKPTSSVQ